MVVELIRELTKKRKYVAFELLINNGESKVMWHPFF